MEALYQGKVDNFCAVYAVLNALRISHGITVYAARDIFNATLLSLARDEEAFRAVLEHTTDYQWLVDNMLKQAACSYPLIVHRPFAQKGAGSAEVWACIEHWLAASVHNTAVLRFCRYLPLQAKPAVDHWSTALRMEEGKLHLLDASLEPSATHVLPQERIRPRASIACEEFFVVPPEALRLMGKA